MEKKSIFGKEKNSALNGELGQQNLKGCGYLLILAIIILICQAII
jgi:hypothetical protein